MCTTSRRILASASTKQGPENGDLILTLRRGSVIRAYLTPCPFRVNMANMGQSRPSYGLVVQVKFLTTFCDVPSSVESGLSEPRRGLRPKTGMSPLVPVAVLNPQPSTLNPQPSTLNSQPSTLNPQSSTLDPQVPTLYPQPSTLNPQP